MHIIKEDIEGQNPIWFTLVRVTLYTMKKRSMVGLVGSNRNFDSKNVMQWVGKLDLNSSLTEI